MAPNPPASISLAGVALLLSVALLLQASQRATAGLNNGGGARTRPPSSSGYVPVRTVVYRSAALPATGPAEAEAYEPFELCMGCRCCPASSAGSSNASSSSCVDTRCCYAIDCNIPGKPFGFCAFSPRTCGCGATNNCTTKPA